MVIRDRLLAENGNPGAIDEEGDEEEAGDDGFNEEFVILMHWIEATDIFPRIFGKFLWD